MKENSVNPDFPKVFVISLPSALDRRQHIEEELGKHAIPFVFFDALNGEQAAQAMQKYGMQVAPGALTSSELGCMMSHVEIWAALVQSDAAAVTILEDDVFLGLDANFFLAQRDWIPAPAAGQIIKLEKGLNYPLLSWKHLRAGNRNLRLLLEDHFGAGAYILGRDSAAGLLAMLHSKIIERPIDHLVFDDYRALRPQTVWQLNPAVCIQDIVQNDSTKLASSLEKDRKLRQEREAAQYQKPNRWQKNLRFLHSPYWKKKFLQLRKFLRNSKVSFQ